MSSSSLIRLPEGIERTGHDLQVLIRGAAGPPAPGVRFLHLASEPPAEAGHVEMVLDHGLPGVGSSKRVLPLAEPPVMLTKLTPISKMRRINPSASSG